MVMTYKHTFAFSVFVWGLALVFVGQLCIIGQNRILSVNQALNACLIPPRRLLVM